MDHECESGSTLLRRRIQSQYDYEIVYKPWIQNGNADALSRTNSIAKEEGNLDALDHKTKAEILYKYHDSVFGGHRGMNKTYEATKVKYSWPNMKREIEDEVKTREKCQGNKLLRPKRKVPTEITTTACQSFEKCALDIVIPLTESLSKNTYLYSKMSLVNLW